MHRTLISALACAVSLTAVSSANATPPVFGGPGMGHAPVRRDSDPKARGVQHWWPDQVDPSELRKNRYEANPHYVRPDGHE